MIRETNGGYGSADGVSTKERNLERRTDERVNERREFSSRYSVPRPLGFRFNAISKSNSPLGLSFTEPRLVLAPSAQLLPTQ